MTDGMQRLRQALEAVQRRDRDEAARILADIVRSNPPLGSSWGSVARLAQKIGEASTAIAAAERHVASVPGDSSVRLLLGQYLAQNSRHLQAIDIGSALIAAEPDNAAAWHFRGTCRAQVGRTDTAEADFREAIRLLDGSASMGWPWMAIAEGKTFQPGDPDIEALQTVLKGLPSAPENDEARSLLNYALGKAWDDLGEVDRAFDAFSAGAEIMKATRNPSLQRTDAFIDQMLSFDKALLERLPAVATATDRPIFVMGLPRSGTTLVEQILVGHSDVKDGAELNLFQTAATPLPGLSPATTEAWNKANPDGLEQIARTYLSLLEKRFGPDGRIVDKTLNHSRFLGLIHAALPQARFVWLRREPGASAWSCFSTRFAHGVDWSWSLSDIGRYFRGEDRLYEHWTSLLGDVILTVPYEELVSDPDTWIPRILAHVGLAPQADLQHFHKAERAVATSSVVQVRQPIHTRAVKGWKRYEARMGPFFEAYGAD